MKTRTILVLFASLLSLLSVTVAQTKEQTISGDKVEVYYFHNERRCATCMAVEDESVKALNELYPEKMKSGEMTFLSVNIEEESNTALAEKYKVSGQTLLIVKGSKQENLTNTAFMYATTKPEKLKKAIGEAIEKL
jgi:hypothetical protein